MHYFRAHFAAFNCPSSLYLLLPVTFSTHILISFPSCGFHVLVYHIGNWRWGLRYVQYNPTIPLDCTSFSFVHAEIQINVKIYLHGVQCVITAPRSKLPCRSVLRTLVFYNKSIVRMIEHEARSDGSDNMASALTISAVTPGGQLEEPRQN